MLKVKKVNLGIPIKRWEKKISSEQSIHYASLFSDFWVVTKKVIQREIKNNDVNYFYFNNLQNDLETIRIRTKQYTEIIVSQVGDYTIVAIQNCRPDFKEVEEVVAVPEVKEKEK
jgi:hypothetical protein